MSFVCAVISNNNRCGWEEGRCQSPYPMRVGSAFFPSLRVSCVVHVVWRREPNRHVCILRVTVRTLRPAAWCVRLAGHDSNRVGNDRFGPWVLLSSSNHD
ncbi:unnamed protein product [Ectocarpus sp. 8 AP-2014]